MGTQELTAVNNSSYRSILVLIVVLLVLAICDARAATMPPIAGRLITNKKIEGRFNERSEVKRDDSDQPHIAIFQIALDSKQTMTIDAESDQFNTRLRVIDAAGKVLFEDEDGGIGHNARLILQAGRLNAGESKSLLLELTSQGKWDVGNYQISMTEGEKPMLQSKEKIEADIAYCERAATLAAASQAERRQGWVLAALGWNHSLLGHYDQLRDQAQRAKQIAEKVGDKKLLAAATKNLGAAAWYQGHASDAIPYFEQALQLRRETGDQKGEANSLDNLGIAYQQIDNRERAIEYFEQALKIYQSLGDLRGQGNELGNLGIAYYTAGDHNRALEYYEQALKTRREAGDPRGEAYDLGNIGVVYTKLGEYNRATVYYELAIKIHRKLGDRRGEQRDLGNLSKAYVFLGEVDQAVECSKQAARIKEELVKQ